MISKINKIKNFAIFNDFRWDNLTPIFKRYNLIYGWNYSGKTTLSRVFRCFQLGQLHDDYRSATFEFELEGGSKYNQLQLNQSFAVRVFNSDFIRENLKWEAGEEGIEPVLLLGEENIKLEQQLRVLREELQEKKTKISELQSSIKIAEEKIEKGLTDKARNIKNTLRVPNYDRRDFEPIVKDIASAPEIDYLSEDKVQKNLTAYQSTDKKETIPKIILSIPDISVLYNQTEMILQKTATANIIKKLKENPILNEWIKDGVALHEGKSICEFCDNRLPYNLLDKYNAHFSEEYNRLMTEIDQLTCNLKNKKVSLELPDKARFYSKFQDKYEQSRNNLESEIEVFNEIIEQLLKILEKKKAKPFETVIIDFTPDNLCSSKIGIEINKINVSIQHHNDQTINFNAEINTAKDRLIKHWASEYAIEIKYRETIKEINGENNEITTHQKEQETIQGKIRSIEQQLSDAVKGAEKINEYLRSYFGTDEIEMTVAGDDKHFKLERSGHPANNLSEGEKTAIAFSHFMTTLEGRGTVLADTIVFIDDPVSSLDCNHLFHTYSVIKNQLADCKQLFISTHNYEFFNLIKNWRRNHNRYPETSLYLIEKKTIVAGEPLKANLKELPKPLFKFNSEYVYLFSLLYKFNENQTPDYEYLYIMPNLVRRYLEAYVGFRSLGILRNNLSILIENETDREKVYKFINEYSHNSSNPRLLHFPDFSECQSVVNIVLTAVQDKDRNHYDALVETCVNGN